MMMTRLLLSLLSGRAMCNHFHYVGGLVISIYADMSYT